MQRPALLPDKGLELVPDPLSTPAVVHVLKLFDDIGQLFGDLTSLAAIGSEYGALPIFAPPVTTVPVVALITTQYNIQIRLPEQANRESC